jgi:hypothetical protein
MDQPLFPRCLAGSRITGSDSWARKRSIEPTREMMGLYAVAVTSDVYGLVVQILQLEDPFTMSVTREILCSRHYKGDALGSASSSFSSPLLSS